MLLLYRYFLISFSAVLVVAYLVLGISVNLAPLSYVFVLLANIYMVVCTRRNFMLFIVTFILFFSNYSIIFANFANTIFEMYTIPLSEVSFNISINILTLFNVFLFLFVRWDQIIPGSDKNIFVDIEKKDTIILYFIYALLIPIFFLGFTVPEVAGQRGSSSAVYEYSAILFLLFFYYCGFQKWHVRFGLFLVAAYSIQSMIYGGRIEAIQFMLVAYIMLFMHKISMTKVLAAIGCMFFLMSIVGAARGAVLTGNADVASVFQLLGERGLALDTAYSAYYTSESFIYIIDKFTFQEIMELFGDFVKSVFIGGDPDKHLAAISSVYVDHSMGGVMPFYFFFYLGVLGIIISASLVAFYLNIVRNLSEANSGFIKCLAIWTVSTTFRWYLYTPLPLLRGVIFLAIAYYSFAYLHFQLDRLPLRRNLQKGSHDRMESAS